MSPHPPRCNLLTNPLPNEKQNLPNSHIEKEVKFPLNESTISSLLSAATTTGIFSMEKVKVTLFRDTYYDNVSTFQLVRNNIWLRKREYFSVASTGNDTPDSWQELLSMPGEEQFRALAEHGEVLQSHWEGKFGMATEKNQTMSVYEEVTEEGILLKRLSLQLQNSASNLSKDLNQWVESNLDPVLSLVTHRTSLTTRDCRFRVDLDHSDIGHCVGEIEITGPNVSESDLEEFYSNLLGQSPTKVMGKLEYMIIKGNSSVPGLRHALKDSGIIPERILRKWEAEASKTKQ